MSEPASHYTPQQWHAARVAGARAVVKLSEKLGRPVDPEVAQLAAEADRPRGIANRKAS